MAKKPSRTQQRRQEREKARRRRQQQYIIGGIVVVALSLLGIALVSNAPADAPIEEETVRARYEGIPTSFTDEGYPVLGFTDAPVRVVEFSSFSCPACANFHDTTFISLLDRIRTGEINFTFIPLQTGSIANPAGANRAALCAGEQGLFWEFHDTLFDWHTRFGNTAFSGNRLSAGIEAWGMDVGAFNTCFNSSRTNDTIGQAQQDGVGLATPTIRVNDVTVGLALTEIQTAISERIPANFVPRSLEAETDEDVTDETMDDAEMTPEADEAMNDAEMTPEADEAMDDAEMTPEADEAMNDAEMTPEADEATEDDTESEPEATEEAS